MSTVVLFLSTSPALSWLQIWVLRDPAQMLENSAMMQSLQNSKVDDANSYLFFKLAVKMHFTISDIWSSEILCRIQGLITMTISPVRLLFTYYVHLYLRLKSLWYLGESLQIFLLSVINKWYICVHYTIGYIVW